MAEHLKLFLWEQSGSSETIIQERVSGQEAHQQARGGQKGSEEGQFDRTPTRQIFDWLGTLWNYLESELHLYWGDYPARLNWCGYVPEQQTLRRSDIGFDWVRFRQDSHKFKFWLPTIIGSDWIFGLDLWSHAQERRTVYSETNCWSCKHFWMQSDQVGSLDGWTEQQIPIQTGNRTLRNQHRRQSFGNDENFVGSVSSFGHNSSFHGDQIRGNYDSSFDQLCCSRPRNVQSDQTDRFEVGKYVIAAVGFRFGLCLSSDFYQPHQHRFHSSRVRQEQGSRSCERTHRLLRVPVLGVKSVGNPCHPRGWGGLPIRLLIQQLKRGFVSDVLICWDCPHSFGRCWLTLLSRFSYDFNLLLFSH